jgi:hypothetical protein
MGIAVGYTRAVESCMGSRADKTKSRADVLCEPGGEAAIS